MTGTDVLEGSREAAPGVGRGRTRAFRFQRHDRLVIDGASYRVAETHRGLHSLQLIVGYTIEDYFVVIDDGEIAARMRGPNPSMRVDEGYYSSRCSSMRVRGLEPDVVRLNEADARTVAWRVEWVRRWHARRRDLTKPRARTTKAFFGAFIEDEREDMDAWYLKRFDERRKPGRKISGQDRKPYDYPGPTALYDWIKKFRDGRERESVLAPGYARCGNRDQLDPRVRAAMELSVKHYCTPLRPKIADLHAFVERELERFNKGRLPQDRLSVSPQTLRTRIRQIDPFLIEAGQDGLDRAMRRYTLTGGGKSVSEFLERVEIDDWEVDLHTLAASSREFARLSSKQRRALPRVRCTVTVAIDVATRCIIGLHLTPGAPSTATARSGLRSTLVDKTPLAEYCDCISPWPMAGRPTMIASDGGGAFGEEFKSAASMVGVGHDVPDQDPRMRGTLETFFRLLKRLCRNFAGQTFSNVVERGDYDSEGAASLTVDEFFRLLVRFVVDVYHNRPHKGLEGRTPLNVWRQKVRDGLPPDLSEQQLKLAFGMSVRRKLEPSGISLMNVRYVVGDHYDKLLRAVGRTKVNVIVDPADIGSVLIELPRLAKGRDWSPEGVDYIEVRPVEGTFPEGPPPTLDALLLNNAAVRAFVKVEAEAGREIRLRAEGDLWDAGIHAMRRAGIPTTGYTEKQLRGMIAASEMKATAATRRVRRPTSGPAVSEETFGTVVTSAPYRRMTSSGSGGKRPDRPDAGAVGQSRGTFGGAMNTYGED